MFGQFFAGPALNNPNGLVGRPMNWNAKNQMAMHNKGINQMANRHNAGLQQMGNRHMAGGGGNPFGGIPTFGISIGRDQTAAPAIGAAGFAQAPQGAPKDWEQDNGNNIGMLQRSLINRTNGEAIQGDPAIRRQQQLERQGLGPGFLQQVLV